MRSSFFHSTVPPFAISTVAGENSMFFIATSVTAAGGATAAAAAAGAAASRSQAANKAAIDAAPNIHPLLGNKVFILPVGLKIGRRGFPRRPVRTSTMLGYLLSLFWIFFACSKCATKMGFPLSSKAFSSAFFTLGISVVSRTPMTASW